MVLSVGNIFPSLQSVNLHVGIIFASLQSVIPTSRFIFVNLQSVIPTSRNARASLQSVIPTSRNARASLQGRISRFYSVMVEAIGRSLPVNFFQDERQKIFTSPLLHTFISPTPSSGNSL